MTSGATGAGSATICPECGGALPSLPRACPGCGRTFRWVPFAALLSAALPGAGHFYLGRRLMACMEAAGGLALFLAALYRLGTVFLRVIGGTGGPLDLVAPCLEWSLILAGYSVSDAVFTLVVSRRRLVPAGARPHPDGARDGEDLNQARK